MNPPGVQIGVATRPDPLRRQPSDTTADDPWATATTSNRCDEGLRFASRRRVLALASAPIRQTLGAVAERRRSGSRHAGTSVGQIAVKLVVGKEFVRAVVAFLTNDFAAPSSLSPAVITEADPEYGSRAA